eukprot:355048-Chlamydomonas_euryale.AAC.7
MAWSYGHVQAMRLPNPHSGGVKQPYDTDLHNDGKDMKVRLFGKRPLADAHAAAAHAAAAAAAVAAASPVAHAGVVAGGAVPVAHAGVVAGGAAPPAAAGAAPGPALAAAPAPAPAPAPALAAVAALQHGWPGWQAHHVCHQGGCHYPQHLAWGRKQANFERNKAAATIAAGTSIRNRYIAKWKGRVARRDGVAPNLANDTAAGATAYMQNQGVSLKPTYYPCVHAPHMSSPSSSSSVSVVLTPASPLSDSGSWQCVSQHAHRVGVV